jgi:hypothetical protein
MERAFEEKRPDVDVLMEGHGSIQCVRHVTELEELADVVAVADYALIPMMMYETSIPFLIGPEGQAVMERNQHPMILPPVADGGDAVPAVLQPLIQSIP